MFSLHILLCKFSVSIPHQSEQLGFMKLTNPPKGAIIGQFLFIQFSKYGFLLGNVEYVNQGHKI